MVFGSLVAGPGGAGAVPLLAGPTGASYNEIHPICVHSRPFAVKNGLFAPPSPVATRSSPSTPLAWQVFAPPDPKTAIFGIFIPRRGPRHSKNRIFRLFPRFQRAVIPSLSRDLGLVTQSRRWNFAENFRLRRCAPALKLTRPRPPRQSNSAILCPPSNQPRAARLAKRPQNHHAFGSRTKGPPHSIRTN